MRVPGCGFPVPVKKRVLTRLLTTTMMNFGCHARSNSWIFFNDLWELVVGHRSELAVTNSISKDEDIVRLAVTLLIVSFEGLDTKLTECIHNLLSGLVERYLIVVLCQVSVDRRANPEHTSRSFSSMWKTSIPMTIESAGMCSGS